jgi:hypothetical protein
VLNQLMYFHRRTKNALTQSVPVPVLRIRDVYPDSNFFYPGPESYIKEGGKINYLFRTELSHNCSKIFTPTINFHLFLYRYLLLKVINF